MRHFLLLILPALLVKHSVTGIIVSTTKPHTDSASWISSFSDFRSAVYNHDKKKVKAFFKFPVMNEGNEIWYVVYSNNDKKINSLPSKIKPFTENDFDKYYGLLISTAFINTIMKVKSGELFKKGAAETQAFKENKNTSYKMYASVDNETRMLSLNLAFNTVLKDKNGEVEDGGEYNIIYQFKITADNKIVFKQIRVAG